MKKIFILAVCSFFLLNASAQNTATNISIPDSTKKIQKVEAACGQCQFKLTGTGCDLAVRIDGKAYFVDGTSINDHGDAHAQDGFCEAIRKAHVQGDLVDNRFKATYFKIVKKPSKEKSQ